MNYRHAFHAGNFADCLKHALLINLIDSFARKPAPYFVLDTHAGAGRYDLEDASAQRTGEADSGIGLLMQRPAPPLERYLGLVQQLGLYPGSPVLIRALMRRNDRLVCCELQPTEAATLRRLFQHDPQVEVHERSGWEALDGLLPPREARGMVFIDSPFEAKDEFATLADRLQRGHRRFNHGVFVAWYPIKQMAAVRGFHASLIACGIRDIVGVELRLKETTHAERLSGCGLIVINPPYHFEDNANSIASAVLDRLRGRDPGAETAVIRLVSE